MDRRMIVLVVSMVGVLSSCGQLQSGSQRDLLTEGLAGWQQIEGKAESWKFEDGILYTAGGGGGWLSTKREYDDFKLELEFRIPPGGNSGVFLRAPHQGNPAYQGMEIQILDDYTGKSRKLRPEQYTGSIYNVQAPAKQVTKKAASGKKWSSFVTGPRCRLL